MGLKLSQDTPHLKSQINSGTGHPKAALGELIAYAVPALYITVFLLAVYDFYSGEPQVAPFRVISHREIAAYLPQ